MGTLSPFIAAMLPLALGFALSGLAACGFEAATAKRASFDLLRAPDGTAVVAVPVVTIGAPYILASLVWREPRRRRSVVLVMAATAAAGLWSLVIGAAALSAFPA